MGMETLYEMMLREAVQDWLFDDDHAPLCENYRFFDREFSQRTKEVEVEAWRFAWFVWLDIGFYRMDYSRDNFPHRVLVTSVRLTGKDAKDWLKLIRTSLSGRRNESQLKKELEFFGPERG